MHACGGTNNCATAIQRFSRNRNDRQGGHHGIDAIALIAESYGQGHRLDYSEAIIHFRRTREVEDLGGARQQWDPWQERR